MRLRETTLWTWQIVTGLVILVLLGLHMAIMHLHGIFELHTSSPMSEDPLDWANVAHRARQMFFVVSYILLLAAGLFHGLNGLRTVLFELDPKPAMRKVLVGVLLLVGFGLLVLGVWAAVAARGPAILATM